MPAIPWIAATAAVVALVVGALGAAAGPAGAAGPVSGFYLAVGGSASVGWQPTLADPDGERTTEGYADDLVDLEAADGVSLDLTQTGCPDETTWAMLSGGDRCYPAPETQLSVAVAFLEAHRAVPGLVSIDLGHNDLFPCLAHHRVDPDCVDQRLGLLGPQLSEILSALRSAAGPEVAFVGVGNYDPFLAAALDGPDAQAFAHQSLDVIARLDRTLEATYHAAHVPMADVEEAFEMGDTTPTAFEGTTAPAELARVCDLTWMCQPPPLGPNIHPNDAGYEAIARAIAAAVPASW